MNWIRFGVLLSLGFVHSLAVKAPGDVCEFFEATDIWGDGYEAHLIFVIDHEVHGWEVNLSFESEVKLLETWDEIITTEDNINFKLTNMEWDADFDVGDTLDIKLNIHGEDGNPMPDLIHADLDGSLICGNGPQPTDGPTEPTAGPTEPTDVPTGPTTTGQTDNQAGKYPYGDVLAKSLLFYEAQRSGPLPANNRVPWRGDSGLSDEVLGGYHDAGDHVKFGFPMAGMTTVLAWGGISFYEGYEKSGQLEWLDDCLKWSMDYFMVAHTSDYELVGQIGDGGLDHAFWGRPEEMTMDRPAFRITADAPGSDLAGETAAALAAGYLYFNLRGDTEYADKCLANARTLFDFADKYRGTYVDSIPQAADFYNSWSGYHDELVWAAAWMAKATKEPEYTTKAEDLYNQFNDVQGVPGEFSWDNKVAGAQLMLWDITGDNKYRANVQTFLDFFKSTTYTPGGLIWLPVSEWASLRHAGNLAHFALQAANLDIDVEASQSFAESQINYILGDTGRSYVVGWGVDSPLRPHHRSSSCPDLPAPCGQNEFNNPGPNWQTLNGALVGGPDQNDEYDDDRANYRTNEVGTDYNAGFQSALAGLNKMY